MMFNLFTMFDPKMMKISMNFMLPIMLMMKMKYYYWKSKNKINIIMFKLNNKSNNMYFNLIMILLLTMNSINLIPIMFSCSNNIMFTFNITLMMWFMMNFNSIINNCNIMFMNMIPKLISLNLILIINLIELNSMLFLIMSLSMRLMINMMMSHIIMFMINNKFIIYFYMMMEIMIIIIQSYVFYILNLINYNNMNYK